MPKPTIDEKNKRARLLKEAKAMEIFSSPLRCEKCNAPVTADMDECWNCSWKKAVDITKVAA